MKRQNVRLPQRPDPHPARSQVAADRACSHRRRTQQIDFPSCGLDDKTCCSPTTPGPRCPGVGPIGQGAGGSSCQPERSGRNDWTGLLASRASGRGRGPGMGREIRRTRRAYAVRLASVTASSTRVNDHQAGCQRDNLEFWAFNCGCCGPCELKELGQDRFVQSQQARPGGGAGELRHWSSFVLALEAAEHTRRPIRKSCGTCEGGR